MNAQRIIDAISPLMTLCLKVTMLGMFGRLTKLATLAIASRHFVALSVSLASKCLVNGTVPVRSLLHATVIVEYSVCGLTY